LKTLKKLVDHKSALSKKMFIQWVKACSFNKHQKLRCVDGFSLYIYYIQTQQDVYLQDEVLFHNCQKLQTLKKTRHGIRQVRKQTKPVVLMCTEPQMQNTLDSRMVPTKTVTHFLLIPVPDFKFVITSFCIINI
jgi:hypothetical protein